MVAIAHLDAAAIAEIRVLQPAERAVVESAHDVRVEGHARRHVRSHIARRSSVKCVSDEIDAPIVRVIGNAIAIGDLCVCDREIIAISVFDRFRQRAFPDDFGLIERRFKRDLY